MPPPPPPLPERQILRLSTLKWHGSPDIICAGDGDEDDYVGTYFAGPTQTIRYQKWSTGHNAHVYTPSAPLVFRYTKQTYVGTQTSEITYYSAIIADHIGPMFQLHFRDEPAFYDRFWRLRPNDFYVSGISRQNYLESLAENGSC